MSACVLSGFLKFLLPSLYHVSAHNRFTLPSNSHYIYYTHFFSRATHGEFLMGINTDRKHLTLENWFPSFTKGTLGNDLFGDISRAPVLMAYRLLITINRSEVVFTGRNLLRGTLIPGLWATYIYWKKKKSFMSSGNKWQKKVSPTLGYIITNWISWIDG